MSDVHVLIVKRSDIEKCPIHSWHPEHYYRRADGEIGCKCRREQ